ncbi:MAG TPA: chemotaxis protein CheB [Geobacterales bacterium]|nr:chemotaxis protein CheB [Geobacterales bacterium]
MTKKEKGPAKTPASPAKGRLSAAGKSSGAASRPQFPVVGIGASAGGLEACTALLKALPVNPGMAFVVVQHLDPHHESILHKLLSKTTEMPVMQVEDGMVLEPNHVYVIPPKYDMAVRERTLRLLSRRRTAGRHLPINRFFVSLAEDQKGAAIGVILSGTASDGTVGLQAIKSEGGVAFAQDPKSAVYPGMPESAILAGYVDFVLPPEEIARELIRLEHLPYAKRTAAVLESEPPLVGAADLQKIIQILRTATGVDLSLYKTGTIKRRVARRMILRKIDSLERYGSYLEENVVEVAALYQDIFIHVTSFFREPETFATLQRKVLPKLMAKRPQGEPLRIWVPGCSTGEEVYSIAITLMEFLDKRASRAAIQIFGTDISAPAVDTARAGTYSETAAANVSPERLKRFFVKVGDGYQIGKQVRDLCVFARHDLGKDPPFSQLDLISCRNVLIYMSAALQERVFSFFHYALKPAGFLLLGKSEALGSSAHLFVQVESKRKIYSRNPAVAVARSALAPTDHVKAAARAATAVTDAAFDLEKAVERIIRQRYAPAALVVDAGLQVLHFEGDTGPYLAPARGAATLNVLKLVRKELALDLHTALHRAKKEETPVRREGIRVPQDGGSKTVNLEVIPMKGRHAKGTDFLILIEEVPAREAAEPREAREEDELVHLKRELSSTREHLQSIIESQEATNEALTVEHEEVLSTNEELQSTNEELETAQEELQSSNEELSTLNEELQNRNAELGQLANDLSNLLVGVSIPVIIVGGDRRIRRFTPAAEPLLNLLPADVGRPISDIRPNIDVPDLDSLISEVSGKGSFVEREVQGRDGHWYSLRMRPYRTAENKIDGVLMALMDIDVMKRGLDQTLRSLDDAVAERDLSASLLDMSGALTVILDPTGRIVAFNHSCQEKSGYSLREAKGRTFWDFLLPPEEVDEAKAAFAGILECAEPARNYERTWIGKDGSRRVIASSSIGRCGADGAVRQIISTGIDITPRKLAQDALHRSEDQLRRLTANLITAQEEERKRVARELHDDVNQRMAMLANEVATLERTLPGSDRLLRKQLRSLREQVDQLSDDLRRTAQHLHPSALEHFGLVTALESHCSDFLKRHQIQLKLTHRSVPESIPVEVSLCLYRVTQECLHNIAKHSGARQVAVEIRGNEEGVLLSIADNGTGFDPGLVADQSGLGLVGIRERVRLVDGIVSINSQPGHGTKIDVRVPLTKRMAP